MNKNDIILATDDNQKDITVRDVEGWIKDMEKYKENLAHFIYIRLYGRYLKPFDFESEVYKKSYKNGFSLMANCCLLIETYISFSVSGFMDTKDKSERCFGLFFTTAKRLSEFSHNGLSKDFFKNVRCGILHVGETRNGWKIRRDGLLFDTATKTIDAYQFSQNLKHEIKDFSERLKIEDINSPLWLTYIAKLENIIKIA